MLFNIQWDKGTEIVGYLVPDTFSGQGTIVVASRGEEVLRMATIEIREALVTAGRHETGLCGFTVDDRVLPGLGSMDDLDITDAETGILIYRRCPPDAVLHRKMFRLETQLLPLAKLDRAIAPFFRFSFLSIDRYGLETTQQLFLMQDADSVFVSGRVPYESVGMNVQNGYHASALIQDPFEELAERILILRLISQGFVSILGMRDDIMFEAAIAFASELSLENAKDLRRGFRTIPQGAADVLSNPLARQLTTRVPGQEPGPSSVSAGLATLASFEVLGLRDQADLFRESLASALTLVPDQLPVIEPIAAVKQLGERLRGCAPVELLLEYDLAIYQQIRSAFDKSGIEE